MCDSIVETIAGNARTYTEQLPIEKVEESLKSDLAEAIIENLPVQVKGDPYGSRKIAIGDFPAVSCGGTHPKSLGTLREVEVTKIKSQKGVLRVSYSVAN